MAVLTTPFRVIQTVLLLVVTMAEIIANFVYLHHEIDN